MPSLKVISETPVTMAELKENIARIKARDKELGYRSNKTEEYLNQFALLTATEAETLRNELEKLEIPRMRPEHLVKLIDLLPITQEEVKTLLSGYSITISNDNCKRIADLVKEHQPKQKPVTQPVPQPEAAEPVEK